MQQMLEDEVQRYQKDTRVFYNLDTNCKVRHPIKHHNRKRE